MNKEGFSKFPGSLIHLIYNVVGEICPGGMTHENCPLRKKLTELEEKCHIGFVELENGNLLAPSWAMLNDDESFDLKKTKDEMCLKCYIENRDKEKNEPEPKTEKPTIQTVILAYQLSGVNCPSGMTKDKCPLRKELAETDEKYNIGYKTLGEKTVLFPRKHYDVQSNSFHDLGKRSAEICYKCFCQNHQNVKE